jgi:hypothetical protein
VNAVDTFAAVIALLVVTLWAQPEKPPAPLPPGVEEIPVRRRGCTGLVCIPKVPVHLTWLPAPPDDVYPPSKFDGRPTTKLTPKFRYVHGERVPFDHDSDDHEWDHFDHSKDECHD